MQVCWDRLTALCWMLAAAAVLAQADHTDVELTVHQEESGNTKFADLMGCWDSPGLDPSTENQMQVSTIRAELLTGDVSSLLPTG